ncbi:MAG: hypothetical protein ABFC80_00905 [Coriobacteriales bacterium]|nr:hypothetical protein [Actinomycetes bacterium]
MAEEIRSNEPTDASGWRAISRRRRRAIALVVAGVVLALIAGGLLAADRLSTREPRGGTPTIQHAETTSAPDDAGGSVASSASVSATGASGATETAKGAPPRTGPPSQPGRALRIAYRKGGFVCVAQPDGTGEVRVLPSRDGAFALSPDAKSVVLVEGGTLAAVDVASRAVRRLDAAARLTPAWTPDSMWIVYAVDLTTGPQVRRVRRDGTGGSKLFDGSGPAVSPKGDVIVGHAEGALVVWRATGVTRVAVDGHVGSVATDGERLYFVEVGDDEAASSLRSVSFDGRDAITLRDTSAAARPVTLDDLSVSFDGAYLAFTECGDDGYSRLFSMELGPEHSVTALSVRRDDYPLGWGRDGRLYFIEGNAFQGESTRLMAVRADGLGRVTLVEGATR